MLAEVVDCGPMAGLGDEADDMGEIWKLSVETPRS